jgi:hypothetical protein
LKSGDSYLRQRRRKNIETLTVEDKIEALVTEDELEEVFTIRKQRHAGYWMSQAFPVMLVIRASNGEIHWMEVRDWLKRASDSGTKQVKEIFFDGERFDVSSVRRWRDRVLGQGPPTGRAGS